MTKKDLKPQFTNKPNKQKATREMTTWFINGPSLFADRFSVGFCFVSPTLNERMLILILFFCVRYIPKMASPHSVVIRISFLIKKRNVLKYKFCFTKVFLVYVGFTKYKKKEYNIKIYKNMFVVALILLQIQTGRVNDRKANKMKKLLI